jgi:hypothetical protein
MVPAESTSIEANGGARSQLSSPASRSVTRAGAEKLTPPSTERAAAISFPSSGAPQTEKIRSACPFGRTATCGPLTSAGARWASTVTGADQVRPPFVERRVSIASVEKFMYVR